MKFDAAQFSDSYIPEDPHQVLAREKGIELGVIDATPGSGAYLRFVASLLSAQSVVEIGTGSGVGTLWLLKGIMSSGVITTIDPEVQHIQIAKQVLIDADIAPNRYRLITSDYLEVMRKLADRAYDLVVFRGNPEDILDVIDEAHRILRVGGILAIDHFYGGGKVPDPAQRDPKTVALRDAGKFLKSQNEHWSISLNPIGDAVLLATKL
ncbi:MAG: methyltransferase domain-containing protein [Candidatus Nanopelagicaceae bacterium]|nr:methyltransferase domain-containing protein [Candidatus Nanopelagicaceae bacterium]